MYSNALPAVCWNGGALSSPTLFLPFIDLNGLCCRQPSSLEDSYPSTRKMQGGGVCSHGSAARILYKWRRQNPPFIGTDFSKSLWKLGEGAEQPCSLCSVITHSWTKSFIFILWVAKSAHCWRGLNIDHFLVNTGSWGMDKERERCSVARRGARLVLWAAGSGSWHRRKPVQTATGDEEAWAPRGLGLISVWAIPAINPAAPSIPSGCRGRLWSLASAFSQFYKYNVIPRAEKNQMYL